MELVQTSSFIHAGGNEREGESHERMLHTREGKLQFQESSVTSTKS